MSATASMSPMSGMTPPPGQGAPPPNPPATEPGASPAPANKNPQTQTSTQAVIGVVNGLRAISKMHPKTAAIVSNMLAEARQLLPLVMQSQQPEEVQAPPA